jgi:hypothetical protein
MSDLLGSGAVPSIFKPLNFRMWVGDFDGSGSDDAVILRSKGLTVSTWNGGVRSKTAAGEGEPSGRLATAFVGDFAQSGHDVVIEYDETNGSFWFGHFSAGSFGWQEVGNQSSAVQGPLFPDGVRWPFWIGDFVGTGFDQLLTMHNDDWMAWFLVPDPPSSHEFAAMGLGSTSGFGNIWDGRPFLQGDFTGAGHDQLIFYTPGDGNWFLGACENADNRLQWRLVGNTQGAHRVPPPTPSTCQHFADELADLKAQVSELQDQLRSAAGSEKAAIIAQIRELNEDEVQVRDDLNTCITQHGSSPTQPPNPWPNFGPINGPIFSGRFVDTTRTSVGFYGNDHTIWLASVIDGEFAWTQAAGPGDGDQALDAGPGFVRDFDGDGLDEILMFDRNASHWAIVDMGGDGTLTGPLQRRVQPSHQPTMGRRPLHSHRSPPAALLRPQG